MRAEIINVGTELLIGSTLNTHQQYLAKGLGELGIDLYTAVTLGDNPQRLSRAVTDALFRSELIIITGGLGPTDDDITVSATARALGLDLILHCVTYQAIQRRLRARGRSMDAFQSRQAYVPKGSRVFPNPNGTAPGLLIPIVRGGKNHHVVLLPGPPRELHPMFQNHLRPALIKILGPDRDTLVVRRLFFPGAFESEIAPLVKDWLNSPPPVTVGIYARPGEVELAVMAKSRRAADAERLACTAEKNIAKRFRGRLILTQPQALPGFIGKTLSQKKQTLAAAESCTGGLLAGRLTDVSGASDYFIGSVTAYSNRIKSDVLGVDEKILKKHGAVSAQTASAMALGAQILFDTNYAISTTGIAGPTGGTKSKPVGLVFIALAHPKGIQVFEHRYLGSRSDIRTRTVQSALLHLAKHLTGLPQS